MREITLGAPLLEAGSNAPALDAKPVFGVPVRIPDDLARGPIALAFVGPLSSPLTRASLNELQAAFAALDRAGVRLVAVSPSSVDEARDYVPRYHLLFPLLLDADRAIARRYGVDADASGLSALAGLRPALLSRALHSLPLGVGFKTQALGARVALFLLDRDGRVRWVSAASGPLQGPDLAGLTAAVSAL